VFVQVSGYSEAELLGQPHSIIRHPDMPRAVFKLLWDTLESGHEVFDSSTIWPRTATITECSRM
jgi:hypothetical protein